MDLQAKLNQISEHFKALSIEEFEKNMIEVGANRIKPSSSTQMRIATLEELQRLGYAYSTSNNKIEDAECKAKYATFSSSFNEVA